MSDYNKYLTLFDGVSIKDWARVWKDFKTHCRSQLWYRAFESMPKLRWHEADKSEDMNNLDSLYQILWTHRFGCDTFYSRSLYGRGVRESVCTWTRPNSHIIVNSRCLSLFESVRLVEVGTRLTITYFPSGVVIYMKRGSRFRHTDI